MIRTWVKTNTQIGSSLKMINLKGMRDDELLSLMANLERELLSRGYSPAPIQEVNRVPTAAQPVTVAPRQGHAERKLRPGSSKGYVRDPKGGRVFRMRRPRPKKGLEAKISKCRSSVVIHKKNFANHLTQIGVKYDKKTQSYRKGREPFTLGSETPASRLEQRYLSALQTLESLKQQRVASETGSESDSLPDLSRARGGLERKDDGNQGN